MIHVLGFDSLVNKGDDPLLVDVVRLNSLPLVDMGALFVLMNSSIEGVELVLDNDLRFILSGSIRAVMEKSL